MVWELYSSKMESCIKDSLKRILSTAKGTKCILTVPFSLEISKMDSKTGKENLYGLMAKTTKANGKTERSTEVGFGRQNKINNRT